MKKKIAINGLGRIGRATLKKLLKDHKDIEVVAVNDLASIETLVHLMRYDSTYGMYEKSVKSTKEGIAINETVIKTFAEQDPQKLPWKELGIDIVLECSGVFRDFEGAKKHIAAGAKTVLISAPSKDSEKIPSYILGVNAEDFNPQKDKIIDMGSCTTNCLAPIVKVLHENYGVAGGLVTTVHSYTADQRLLDAPHKDLRRARAAAANMVPTTTGATKAIGKVIPELEGKFEGIAIRVPTLTVSILDLVARLEKKATREEVNYTLNKAAQKKEYHGIIGVEDAPLVSSDYIGNSFSAVVDYNFTAVQGDAVKIIAWYDNEWAYACRLAEMAEFISTKI